MTRPPRAGLRRLRPVLCLVLLTAIPDARSAEAPLSLPVAVEVRDDAKVAAERSLRLLELAMIDEIRRAQCVRETVSPGTAEPPEQRLLLRVVVRDVVEDSTWEMGTAGRAEAVHGGAQKDPAPTSRVRVSGETEIVVFPESLRVKHKNFVVQTSQGLGGMHAASAESVRDDAIARVAVEARNVLCGSRGKLQKQIDRAKSAANPRPR